MNSYIRKNLNSIIFIIILITLFFIAINNLIINLDRANIGFSLNWLNKQSGFSISESTIQFKSSDTYLWAILAGWMNSLKVISYGLILSTIIGTSVALGRLSKNILLRRLSSIYVALIRQTPLLLQLLFWYFVVFLRLPKDSIYFLNSAIIISNKGIIILGAKFTVEFISLLVGLSLFTGASISEVIRGGINSINKGQSEAYKSLGIQESIGIRIIILPQSLPAILPGLTNQYLNLAKNSTLAIAIGYPEIYAINDTAITQTGRAIEGFLIILFSFLILNIIINKTMSLFNNFALRLNQNYSNHKL